MTTEQERRERFEELDRTLAKLKANTASMAQRQREQIDRGRKMLDDQQEKLDEAREDTKRTRRLWDRLAAKHGWPDYEDLDRDSW